MPYSLLRCAMGRDDAVKSDGCKDTGKFSRAGKEGMDELTLRVL